MRISDWSSDVCSSDLQHALEVLSGGGRLRGGGTVLAAGHAGQDVVAGAVEDAVDAVDAVGGEAPAQALDDGTAAGHRPEARRVGKERVSTCCSRRSSHY